MEALKLGGALFLIIMTIAAFFHFAYFLIRLLYSFLSRLFHRRQVRHCSEKSG